MLETIGIHKVYKSGRRNLEVLKGVDLKIEQGSWTAIVGPSGAGKSTLLHILGGLDSPDKGRVIFEGEDFYSLGEADLSRIRNKKIAFVFQFYHLLPEFTVLENVLMPARLQGAGFKAQRDCAAELLEQVGLKARAEHFPSQLSGGEKQRTAIARALINRPSILFCDEPTGNLDSKIGNQIIALIKKINQESRMAVVLVTHNPELAEGAEKIYHLKDGALVNQEEL